jgi:poly-gamma-glutamate synthesis protein (capsule biosynthesis protein)
MTGDIMLGRVIERIIDENGFEYPFKGVSTMIKEHDVVVGNLEAAVPRAHEPTPPYGMQFSMRREFMGELRMLGFDVLSLANNHAFDFGLPGYENTLAECNKASLVCSGHPFRVSTSSLLVTQVGDVRVGIIFLHTLFNEPTSDELTPFLTELKGMSDVQIAYIHWGEEYQEKHNVAQEAFAHLLIDNGIDAIVGHHPHVMQDIEKYRGKPIFYSLGNLVFDQYFSDAVQEGYLLTITMGRHSLTYSLSPYTSASTPSQPHLINESDGQVLSHTIFNPDLFTEEETAALKFNVLRD